MEGAPDQCSTGAAFARGGPIFVPDLISPMTSVFDFKSSLLSEISNLEAELDTPTADFDDELSVDEIKVFSEEELVEIALREGFEDDLENADISQNIKTTDELIDHPSVTGEEIVCLRDSACQSDSSLSNKSIRKEKSEQEKSKKIGQNLSNKSVIKKKSEQKKGKKRGRTFDRESRAAQLEGNYLIRVKELAKLKQKQDEDKLQVRLHSFSGSSKSTEVAKTTSVKNESMRSLRSITHPIKKKFVGSQKFVPFCNQPEVLLFVELYHNRITSQKIS